MEKVKAYLNGMAHAVGKVLLIFFMMAMLAVMCIWTVGLVYISNEGRCSLEDNRVVCEIVREEE